MTNEILLCVLTLNCWAIPFVSKNRDVRMKAIAEELSSGKYDIVCLQEVWSSQDFNLIKDKAKTALPYSHYFHSGVAGSGVCILSRFPIHDVLFHQWAINGYVHKLHHGDWFGGKGVGLCQISVNGLLINVYTAHLHAEYDRKSDEYAAHRVLQAFDTAQFIHLTSGGADLVLLGGDLNTEPDDLAYQVLLMNAGLHDAFLQPTTLDKTTFGTFRAAQNSYTSPVPSETCDGQRLDYILYKAATHGRTQVSLESYSLPLPETIPGQSCSFSDHEAVMARLRVTVSPGCGGDRCDRKFGGFEGLESEQDAVLGKALDTVDRALSRVGSDRRHYWLMSGILLLLLVVALCAPGLGWGLSSKQAWGWGLVLVPIVTAVLCYTLFMATLWNNMEVNAILAGKLGMHMTQARLRAQQAAKAAQDIPLSTTDVPQNERL